MRDSSGDHGADIEVAEVIQRLGEVVVVTGVMARVDQLFSLAGR